MKKYIAILLCIVSLLLSSCTAHENISFIDENGETYLQYQDVKYYKSSVFTVTERFEVADENDIQLGWFYSFPFSTYAYSDTPEKPVYIYTLGGDSNLYFRQDYNYLTDTFVIANTTAEIVWEDIFGSKQNDFYFEQPIEVTLSSKQYPRIKSDLEFVCVDNEWYFSLPNFQGVWTPSEEFINVLLTNGVLRS